MKIKYCFYLLIMLLFSSTTVGADGEASESTVDDQLAVEVTVYNNNLGLVKETRKIKLPPGKGELRFMDVASQILPVTVLARSINNQESFSILEQNYEYDLMSANKLLDKYLGKKIKIIVWNEFQDRKEEVEATLLSNNKDQIYKINDEIYLGHPGIKILPEIPENLIANPTLTWLYENKSKKAHSLEVSYLTTNISWKADYVMVLNKGDTSADISGWVTLDNKSGATYKNAGLKLIAGDVHRAEKKVERFLAMEAMGRTAAPQFKEKAFFEYHIYNLERKTTIKDRQTKQLSLLGASNVKIRKEFLLHGLKNYFTRNYKGQTPKQPVNVYLNFNNSSENNLGMPLPSGIIRLYKEDDDGSQQFIGEDRIEHTSIDEELKLQIGKAFDVVAERIQTDFKQISTKLYESEWQITLRNHKKEGTKIGIVEPLFGNWNVKKSSHPFKKVDAFTIRFDVNLPAGNEVKVKYRVRVGL